MKKIIIIITCFIGLSGAFAQQRGMFHNPVIEADVPAPSMIRVGNYYYLVSTTMPVSYTHLDVYKRQDPYGSSVGCVYQDVCRQGERLPLRRYFYCLLYTSYAAGCSIISSNAARVCCSVRRARRSKRAYCCSRTKSINIS